MRAYEIQPGTKSLDALRQVERPEPRPGPTQVLIRVRAAGLNRRDHSVIQGIYAGPPLTRPMIPLSDGAGEVVAVGAAVRRFKVGDRVASCFFQRWNDGPFTASVRGSELGAQNEGMLAELVALDENGVVALPEHLSFEEAATLPCAAVTAWHALFARGGLKPGDWVLALGTGGVSVAGLQLAKAAGARVVITSSSDDKLARARALGADGTVNYKATPEWHEAVRRLTGGEGAHQVLEVGGSATITRSIEAVRLGGFIHQIGFVGGRETALNLPRFVATDATWRGVYVGSRAMFEAMNAAIAASRLRPVVDRVFPFEEARAAYAYQGSGAHFGKVVIALS
jgi:NADPH:quinone reductase-like Zn-dependent oxidoreductase